ncbi:putative transmembrane protein [Toxoplasma gondii p89]|uniref:Putative transmembrane protein n=1 Tax=Toxoplasma gondii p89 TaxID=943119 RepID=A0A086KE46_TOXGO|nr:putative transmembrane protein [Toxoplasma gondii p89]
MTASLLHNQRHCFLAMQASRLRRQTWLPALSGRHQGVSFTRQLSILFLLLSVTCSAFYANVVASDDGPPTEDVAVQITPDASLPDEVEASKEEGLGFAGIPRSTMYSIAKTLIMDGPAREARTRKLVELGERLSVKGMVLDLTIAQPPAATPQPTRRLWVWKQAKPDAPKFDVEEVVKSIFQKFVVDVEKRAMADLKKEDPELAFKLKDVNVSAELRQLVASRLSNVEVISPSDETTNALHAVAEFFTDLKANREKYLTSLKEKIDFHTPIRFSRALMWDDKDQQVQEVLDIAREEARKRVVDALDEFTPEDRVAMGSLGIGVAYLEEAILERMVNPYIMDRADPDLYRMLRGAVDQATAKLHSDRKEEKRTDAALFREKSLLSIPTGSSAFVSDIPSSTKLSLGVALICALVGAAVLGLHLKKRKKQVAAHKKKVDDAKLNLDLEELLIRPLDTDVPTTTSRRNRTRSSRSRRLEIAKRLFVEPEEGQDISVGDEEEVELEAVPVVASSSRFH